MNTYLTKCKVDFIKQARTDFYELTGVTHTPFTRKNFFYFFVYDNKKYVHKEALKFVYTNADTWTDSIDPIMCSLTKQTDPVDVIDFLQSTASPLLPTLVQETSSFLIYEYVAGDPVVDINTKEFYTLRDYSEQVTLTPFYNSMTYNIVRSPEGIKLVDLKHFDRKLDLPFYVYFFNEDAIINTLHVDHETDIASIRKHLGRDYPVDDAKIIKHEDTNVITTY
jgi:hypothetical protein